MKTIDELRKLWEDGTIPRAGKSEMISLFNSRFGFTGNDSFRLRIKGLREATPAQEDFLNQYIPIYWNKYNAKRGAVPA